MQQFSKDKNIPVRSFLADETKNASGLNGPKAIADDIDVIIKMFDPDAKISIYDETGEPGQAQGGIDERNLKQALRQKIQDAYDYTKNYYDFSLLFRDSMVTEFLESFDSLYQSYVVENKQLRCNAYCENTLSCAVSAMSCVEYVEQNDGGGELVSFTFDFDFPDGRTYKLIVSNPNTAEQEVVFTNTTLPDWAMQPNKPTYTADEVGSYSKTKIDMDFKGIYTVMGNNAQVIGGMKTDIEGLQQQIREEAHFRGYLSTNAEIQTMDATPNDFAYSAESGTVWLYTDKGWQNTMNSVPDQLTPASTTTPLMNGEASKGQEEAYARGDHRHPHDSTKVDKTEFDTKIGDIEETLEEHSQELSKKLEETVLHEEVVNTPVWQNQPTYEGNLAIDTSDFYYVTLKNTDGTALPSGQFKLMPMYDKYAEAYETVFTLDGLKTGNSGTLTENLPVEFTMDYKMRTAGVERVAVTMDLPTDSSLGKLTIETTGQFVKKSKVGYFASNFTANKTVAHYNSGNTTTSNSEGDRNIWHFVNNQGDDYKIGKFVDTLELQMNGEKSFITHRHSLLRSISYGTTTYKNIPTDSVGFGFILSENTKIIEISSYAVTSGYIRNGSVFTVTEVK